MSPSALVRVVVFAAMWTIAAMTGPLLVASQDSQSAPKPQPAKSVVIRGCLTREKLSRIDPQNVDASVEMKLPDVLRVTSIRVIRSQVKVLNGHQVEVKGTLRGIPGLEAGLLVAGSDKGKLYIGGDPIPGRLKRKSPPSMPN